MTKRHTDGQTKMRPIKHKYAFIGQDDDMPVSDRDACNLLMGETAANIETTAMHWMLSIILSISQGEKNDIRRQIDTQNQVAR